MPGDCSPDCGLGKGLRISCSKNIMVQNVIAGLKLGCILWNNLRKKQKMDIRFPTWNVRNVYRLGSM
jgi:hypothetical protein